MSQENDTPTTAEAPQVLVTVTTFPSLNDSAEKSGPVPWEGLYTTWRDREPLPSDTKKESQKLISPATFTGRRALLADVVAVHFEVVEFDNKESAKGDDGKIVNVPLPPERRCTFEQAVEFVRGRTWDAILVTSYSHAPDHHRFRVYLRTDRPVTPPEHERIQRELLRQFDEAGMIADPATMRANHRWFVPIRREGCEYRVERVVGAPIDVDEFVASLRPESGRPEPKTKATAPVTRLDQYTDRLREAVDMIELLEEQGERVERRGHYARLHRPFGDDGTKPGCVVYHEHYYDFGRCECVDAIGYVQKKLQLTFWDALDWLADRARIPRFDRSKARRVASIDPQHAFDTLPLQLPETGREEVLRDVVRAIATLDDTDRGAWIDRVVDRFRPAVEVTPVDPTPYFEALPAKTTVQDAEHVVAPVIAAASTLSPTEQRDWIDKLVAKWKDGRRSLIERSRLEQLFRASRKEQQAAARAATASGLDRKVIDRIVRDHSKQLDRRAVDDGGTEYEIVEGCLHLVRKGADGEGTPQRLLNGDVQIVECVTHDMGGTAKDYFHMKATFPGGDVVEGIEVPSDEFDSCEWITPATRGRLRVETGVRDARRYIAHAILSRSRYEHTRTFSSFGWHDIGGKQAFIHAGGAIGTSEPLTVRPPHPKLGLFDIPEIVVDKGEVERLGYDAARRACISRGVVRQILLLRVAPPAVALPLFASSVSAPLMPALPTRVPVLLLGHTGVKKSALALEHQRQYGTFATTDDFLLNFESTSTATSYLGHVPQHLLGVADDAFPKGTSAEMDRQRGLVRSLVHNYVNGQTRERGTKDHGLASSRPIRCLLWLTAETDMLPAHLVESTANRVLKISLKHGDVREAILTEIQSVPDLTIGMRAYIEHLARDPSWRQTVPARVRVLVAELRGQRASLGLQDRQPEMIATLLVSFETWLGWATQYIEGADDVWTTKMIRSARNAIIKAAVEQTMASRSTNPAATYVDLLRSLLRSGRARLVPIEEKINGSANPPEIGWYDKDRVVFEPASAHHEVLRYAEHDVLPYAEIYSRLVQDKLCEPPAIEKSGVNRRGTRITAGGARAYMLVFPRSTFADIVFTMDDLDEEAKAAVAARQAALSVLSDDIANAVLSSPGGQA